MGKQKFYVVWKGNNPGVYQSWEKCQKEIKNVNGALFKSFDGLEEAKKAYEQGYEEYKQILDYINISDGPELNSISVDEFSNFSKFAATAVAHAAVPHALVNPAPLSQTLTL